MREPRKGGASKPRSSSLHPNVAAYCLHAPAYAAHERSTAI